MKSHTKEKIGPVAKKILILLNTGLTLSLNGRPDRYIRILKDASKEWDKINQRTLHTAIKQLYKSKLVEYKENDDGTISMVLTDEGKAKTLVYDLDKMVIAKPKRWDSLWHLVIFDVPEHKKKARKALSGKLFDLGLYPMQKSVFIYPYECRSEVEFIAEIFQVRPYVRFLLVKNTDIDLDLKYKFGLN